MSLETSAFPKEYEQQQITATEMIKEKGPLFCRRSANIIIGFLYSDIFIEIH